MWTKIYNEDGRLTETGYERFKSIMRQEHQTTVKVEMLDTSMNPIDGGELFSADQSNRLTNFVTDGNVDVDVSRGTRRTAELTLLNPTADFTPNTDDFTSDGDWVGKMYLNRMVRIFRGVYNGRQALYAPVGTFFVDTIDVQVEQNMSQVVLSMSDRWKVFTKSIVASDETWSSGTNYNTIIGWHCTQAGIGVSDRVLDPISGRDHTIDKTLRVKSGDNRGDTLKDLAKRWNIDMYFDPMGIFRTEDRKKMKDKQTVWYFKSEEDGSGMLVNIKRSFNDDNLYNHVIVIGLVNKKPFRVERKNTNPASKMSVNRIGDRALYIRDDNLNTAAKANNALDKAWELRVQMSESMEVRTICNPLLEGDDAIAIVDRDFAKVDDRYRLSAFNIPLVTSLQTIQVNKILKEEDIL